MKAKLIFSFVAALVISFAAYAQEPAAGSVAEKVVVTTHDGIVRVGVVVSDDGREILLETENLGKIYILKSDVKTIRPFAESDRIALTGEYQANDPFSTRYYFTTNALPIRKGEDYGMLNLYGPEVHFSLADNFSAGIMSTWIASPFVGVFKLSIPTRNDKVSFGIGTLLGSSGYLNSFKGAGGLHWGMLTLGDRRSNITFSAGYLYVGTGTESYYSEPGVYPVTPDEFGGYYYPNIPYRSEKNGMVKAPSFSIAGVTPVGSKSSFIFDSMFFVASQYRRSSMWHDNYDSNGMLTSVRISDESGYEKFSALVLMPGVRFQHREGRAFQIALAGVTVFQDGDVYSFPLPNCSWFFKI
ncbi:MAG: hypothetical protein RIB71_23770 [Imperialibacter sp.]|uniref:hypothetical protein n=1 Tax=Imperialibacter sp. TaxID=2038411 RepID=UPI0032F07B27